MQMLFIIISILLFLFILNLNKNRVEGYYTISFPNTGIDPNSMTNPLYGPVKPLSYQIDYPYLAYAIQPDTHYKRITKLSKHPLNLDKTISSCKVGSCPNLLDQRGYQCYSCQ